MATAKRSDAARGLLWVVLAAVMTLLWFGPASWLRGDTAAAESAERAADDAETAAQTPPPLAPETARTVIDGFEALCLTVWSDEAAFWPELLPDPPEGLLLTSLGYSEPERSAAGVHLRNVSMELTVPADPDDPDAAQRSAPGGLDATWEWVSLLNDRSDMELVSVELSTTGSAKIGVGVWMLDAPEDTDPDNPDTGGGGDTTADPGDGGDGGGSDGGC